MNDRRALVHLAPIGALTLVLAAGCTGSGTAGRAAGSGDELLLSSSLSGEQCRIRSTSVSTGARRLEEFEIGCAGWEEPSGFIWRMPQIGQANLAEMLTDDDLPLWQIRAVSCGALEDAGGGAAPTLVRRCASEEGWPYLLTGAEDPAKGWTYLGWGLPHVAPVFERFVADEGGRADPVALRRGGTRWSCWPSSR